MIVGLSIGTGAKTQHQMVNNVKQNGVVYTPEWIVQKIVDRTIKDDFCDVIICDPASGDGAFLSYVVEKICRFATTTNEPKRDSYLNSLKLLTGFDISATALRECEQRLTAIANKHFPDQEFNWNLQVIDGIDKESWIGWEEKFDYVVGNPPYVRIQHLEDSRRNLIKNRHWISMRGCTDLYILFFEYGISLLKDGGMLGYITPRSWFTSNAGQSLRNYLEDYSLRYLCDFRDYQVFEGVTTYTAITVVQKSNASQKPQQPEIERYDDPLETSSYKLVDYRGKYVAVRERQPSIFRQRHDSVLGDIADIQVGIQTLADRVFILKELNQRVNLIECEADGDVVLIERGVINRILKTSVMKNGTDPINRIIIYPYDASGSLLAESDLADLYPHAYRWLSQNKEILLNRDKGVTDNYRWYEYGRSVGIRTGFGTKILTSSMNLQPNFQLCTDASTLFYAGYSIKPKNGIDIHKLLDELNSAKMAEYIDAISKPFQHGWKSYAKSYIQDYPVQASTLVR